MKYDVYGIGNALLDKEFETAPEFLSEHAVEKGVMTLVDEARQIYLAGVLGQAKLREVAPGGSAANTMIALQQLGGRGFYSCRIASDESGDRYYADMRAAGLDSNFDRQEREPGHTGVCMAFVTHDADRTMNTFLGTSEKLSVKELDLEAIKESKYLYIEGYLMTSPTAFEAVQTIKQAAREAGVKIAMTLSDPFIVSHFKAQYSAVIGQGVDLLFCNEEEALMYTGADSLDEAIESLKSLAKVFTITRGKDGALIYDGHKRINVKPNPVDVVDTLGAGDSYAGAFLAAITQGWSYEDAGQLASLLSSEVVKQYGPRLSVEYVEQLKAQVEKVTGAIKVS